METVYKPKKLERTGALFSVFLLMLILASFVTSAQTSVLNTAINCWGQVYVKMPTATDPTAVIQGPCPASTFPVPGPANQIWQFKVVPDPGFYFVSWTSGGTSPTYEAPTYIGGTVGTDYTHQLTMATGDKYVQANFQIIDPCDQMSSSYTISTIPGTFTAATTCDPIGSPIQVRFNHQFDGISGSCASSTTWPSTGTWTIFTDFKLVTNRNCGTPNSFNGLRIIDIQGPTLGAGVTFPIYLTGTEQYLSTLINIPAGTLNAAVAAGALTSITIVFDGITNCDTDFDIDIHAVGYRAPKGTPECVQSFNNMNVHVQVGTVTTTSPSAQMIQCDGPTWFPVSFTLGYPAIANVEPSGAENFINLVGDLTFDQELPIGTIIAYQRTGTNPASGTYTLTTALPALTPLDWETFIGSDFINAHPNSAHSSVYTLTISQIPSGRVNLDIQPKIELLAECGTKTATSSYLYRYNYGTLMETELVNTKVVSTLTITTDPVYTATGTPIILGVTANVTPSAWPHTGFILDGKFVYPGGFPTGTVLQGARLNSVNVPLVGGVSIALNGTEKKFSEMFASGWVRSITTTANDSWEFDIYADTFTGTRTITVQYLSGVGTPANCLLSSDVATVTYAAATMSVTTNPAPVCLNHEFYLGSFSLTFPSIANIEPAPVQDIRTGVLFTCNRNIVAGSVLSVTGAWTGSYTFPADVPAGTTLTLAALSGIATPTLASKTTVTDTYNLYATIPGYDAAGLTNAGTYSVTIQPVVTLSPYTNYNFIAPQVLGVNIPTYWVTMQASPAYGGTTSPTVAGPYEYGCGTKLHVTATPSPYDGWTFQEWSHAPGAYSAPGNALFDNYLLSSTIFNVPSNNATVTAHFDQNEYTFSIGVVGAAQKVIVWVDGATSAFELTGNRECAPIEPTSGTYYTFTHGETVLLEIIPTSCYLWDDWKKCDNTAYTGDSDLTYLGLNSAGHPLYQLVFRSNKELKAWFKKKLTITATVPSKTYDCNTYATFNSHSQYTLGYPGTCSPTFVTPPGSDVQINLPLAVATFSSKDVEWNTYPSSVKSKTVTITNLQLTGTHAPYYILVDASGVPTTVTTTLAQITPVTVTVGGSPVASNKLYGDWASCTPPATTTITGAVISGILSCDLSYVKLQNHTSGTFSTTTNDVVWTSGYMSCVASQYVNWAPSLTYSGTTSTTFWQNYVLTPPAQLTAKILPRPIVRTGIVANTKEFDGTNTATIGNWGSWQTGVANKGIVCSDPVDLDYSAYAATFQTCWVGTKTVTVTGLTLKTTTGSPSSTKFRNYVLENYSVVTGDCYTHLSVDGTGTIVAPAYAMFSPSYTAGTALPSPDCACTDPNMIENVRVQDPLYITYSRNVYDFQGQTLPTIDLGEFVKLDLWIGTGVPTYGDATAAPSSNWTPVTLYSTRSGNTITIVPGVPPATQVDLQFGKYYRLRYDDIWTRDYLGNLPISEVHWRLDKNTAGQFDPNLVCGYEDQKQIIFKTIEAASSAEVTPSGCSTVTTEQANYSDVIKVTFVNPMKYRNGTLISLPSAGGDPTHKFQLWARPKNTWSQTTAWTPVLFEAIPSDYEQELGGPDFGPKTITIVPLDNVIGGVYYPANQMLLCYDYYVEWRDVNDLGEGFLDMNTGDVVGGDVAEPWNWCTRCDFPIDLSYTANSALTFPPSPGTIRNNLKLKLSSTTLVDLNLDGTTYSPNGKIKSNYYVIKPNNYTFEGTIGQGFHVKKWTRKTGSTSYDVWSNGSAYQYTNSSPGLGWSIYTGTTLPWACEPYSYPSFQKYGWNVDYELNTYNIGAAISPSGSGWGTVNFGGTTWYPSTTVTKSHGDPVSIYAKPFLGTACASQAKGYYHKGWSYTGTWLQNPVSNFTTYDPIAAPKPTFLVPPTGSLTGNLTDAAAVHGATYTATAIFDVFNPRIDITVQNDMGDPTTVGQVNFETQFVLGEDWGIIYTATNYAVFKYNTPVKLIPISNNCGWEFDQWLRWDGTYTNPPANTIRRYVPFSYTPNSWICVTECYDIIAKFKRVVFPVTVTTQLPTQGSVLLEGMNATGTQIQLLSNVTNPVVGDNFKFETVITLTVYPIPGYEVKSWNNPNVTFVSNYIDRSVWQYSVGAHNCEQPFNLVATLGLRQWQITGQPTYNSTYNPTTGQNGKLGNVTGSPSAGTPTLNKFTNYTATGTNNGKAIGTFEHFVTGHQLTATPIDSRFKFDYWNDDRYGNIGSANPLILPPVSETRTITAVFVPNLPTYPAVVNNNILPGNTTGGGTTTVDGGSSFVGPQTFQFFQHNAIPTIPSTHVVTQTPDLGYELVNWTYTAWPGMATPTIGIASSTLTFNMPGNGVNIQANYRLIEHPLTMNVRTYLRPESSCPTVVNYGGVITDMTNTAPYHTGETILLDAFAVPGFEFVNFMVGQVSGTNGCVLTGREIPGQTQLPNGHWQVNYTVPPMAAGPVVVYAIFREQTFPNYPKHTLTTASNPAGKATLLGAGNYVQSVVVPVFQTDANLTDGYHFSHYTVNGIYAGTANPLNVTMNGENKNVVAHYVLTDYLLEAYAVNGLGTVTAGGNTGNPAEKWFTIVDDPIYCTAVPATHYMFDKWTYDYDGLIPVLDVLGNPVTQNFYWIPVAANTQIYAHFVPAPYTVTLNTRIDDCTGVVGGGTAAIIAGPPAPYHVGDEITLLATPFAGYTFKHWTDESCQVIVTQPQFNWTINGSVTFFAIFEAIPYTVNASVQSFTPPAGTVTPTTQIKTVGQQVTVTATVNAGYTFTGWAATGITLANPAANPAVFNMPPNNVTLVAQYVPINYNVTATAQTGGTVNPTSQTKTINQPVTVTATPLPGYTFNGFEATGVTLANPMANPATFNMPANNVQLLAKFECIPYNLTVVSNPAGAGTFAGNNPTYCVGNAVAVTATANSGWIFNGWSAVGVTLANPMANPAAFNMPANAVQLTANFIISNNTIAGQVKYFNQFETVMPSSANIKVALDNGGVLSQEQFLQYVPGQPQGYYQFNNIVPGTNYTIRIWEAPTGGTVGNTWSWNNWGGVNSLDALIISYMYLQNPTLATQFPWLVKPGQSVPNWSEYFGGLMSAGYTHNYNVANCDQNGVIDNLDALLAMYRSIGQPGTSPFPGGAFNFQIAGQFVPTLGTMVYPAAPTAVFNQTGTYLAAQPAGSVYYTKGIVGAAGAQLFNIFYEATGDVNASYIPGSGAKATGNTLAYEGLVKVNVGDEVKIPVTINQDRNISAMNIGLTYNTSLLKVTGVEGFEVFNIDEVNGLVNATMFDVEGKAYDRNNSVIVVTARVLAPIETGTRYFELTENTIFADASATPIDGITLYTTGMTTDQTTGSEELSNARLTHKCFPNPFNDVTTIQYTLPEKANVEVKVYNSVGSVVKIFVSDSQVAGVHNIKLNSTDLNGSGVYFYRISVKGDANSYTGTGSLILVK